MSRLNTFNKLFLRVFCWMSQAWVWQYIPGETPRVSRRKHLNIFRLVHFMCYFASDFLKTFFKNFFFDSKHSSDNSPTYVRMSWMDAIEIVTPTEDVRHFFRWLVATVEKASKGDLVLFSEFWLFKSIKRMKTNISGRGVGGGGVYQCDCKIQLP